MFASNAYIYTYIHMYIFIRSRVCVRVHTEARVLVAEMSVRIRGAWTAASLCFPLYAELAELLLYRN